MTKKKEYMWRLLWSGQKDSEALRAATKFLEVFPLWKDSKCHLVTFEEFNSMVETGKLEPPMKGSTWTVEAGEVGCVSNSYYSGYYNTWEKINTAFGDFTAGWDACEKKYKFLADWDEAIAMNKDLINSGKRRRRSLRVEVPNDRGYLLDSEVDRLKRELGLKELQQYRTRNDKKYIAITKVCTAKELVDTMDAVYEELREKGDYYEEL